MSIPVFRTLMFSYSPSGRGKGPEIITFLICAQFRIDAATQIHLVFQE